MYEKLTNENILMFAIRHYDNPQCEGEYEFHDDMKRFKYIKRLLRKYDETGELKERLILNHIISFYNVFKIEAANRMLFLKVSEECKPALKTFLIYLNYLPQGWHNDIPLDNNLIRILREL